MTVLVGRLISGIMTLSLGVMFIVFGDIAGKVDGKDSFMDTVFLILGIVMIIVGGVNSLGSFKPDEPRNHRDRRVGEAV